MLTRNPRPSDSNTSILAFHRWGQKANKKEHISKSAQHGERKCTFTSHKQVKLCSQAFACPYLSSSNSSSSRWASIVKSQRNKLQGLTATAWQSSCYSGHNALKFTHSLNTIQRQSTEISPSFTLPCCVRRLLEEKRMSGVTPAHQSLMQLMQSTQRQAGFDSVSISKEIRTHPPRGNQGEAFLKAFLL